MLNDEPKWLLAIRIAFTCTGDSSDKYSNTWRMVASSFTFALPTVSSSYSRCSWDSDIVVCIIYYSWFALLLYYFITLLIALLVLDSLYSSIYIQFFAFRLAFAFVNQKIENFFRSCLVFNTIQNNTTQYVLSSCYPKMTSFNDSYINDSFNETFNEFFNDSLHSDSDPMDTLSFMNDHGRSDIHTFRFKLSDSFTNELMRFSKIHQYDDRKTFKAEWIQWTDDHADLVHKEAHRLSQAGYTGDALQKMFVSARYYFRNKSTASTVDNAQVGRKKYVRLDTGVLRTMDEHILHHVLPTCLKPHDGYLNFCKLHAELLLSGDADKIKKTYKNRYSKLSVALAKACP